jgi:hypothetical protein
VSGFSAEWLGLREPFDAAARAPSVARELALNLDRSGNEAPLEILDLGAGAGSNFRYLAPLLGGLQRWRLADNDPKLLDAALGATHSWAGARGADARRARTALSVGASDLVCHIETELADLSDLTAVELPAGGLVTAAALLDLVSQDWLETLAQRCRAAGAAVAFALTYDGRTTVEPAEHEDALVLSLFNRHQRLDKGFGPALGPAAAGAAEAAFEAHGYELRAAPSDWVIGPKQHAMQLALLDGWLAAALEMAPENRSALTSWHERRRSHMLAGRSQLRVGHIDLIGWL